MYFGRFRALKASIEPEDWYADRARKSEATFHDFPEHLHKSGVVGTEHCRQMIDDRSSIDSTIHTVPASGRYRPFFGTVKLTQRLLTLFFHVERRFGLREKNLHYNAVELLFESDQFLYS